MPFGQCCITLILRKIWLRCNSKYNHEITERVYLTLRKPGNNSFKINLGSGLEALFLPFPFLLPNIKTDAHWSDFFILARKKNQVQGTSLQAGRSQGSSGGGLSPASLVWQAGLPAPFWSENLSVRFNLKLDLKLQEASVLSFQVEQPHSLATHNVSSFDSLKSVVLFSPSFFLSLASTSSPHSFWSYFWFLLK